METTETSVNIEVRLFASFREGRFPKALLKLEEGRTLESLVEQLGIRSSDVGVFLINGKHAPLEQQLREGDVVALFPPIAGG